MAGRCRMLYCTAPDSNSDATPQDMYKRTTRRRNSVVAQCLLPLAINRGSEWPAGGRASSGSPKAAATPFPGAAGSVHAPTQARLAGPEDPPAGRPVRPFFTHILLATPCNQSRHYST
ncbi:hypothetical protein PAHAL_2G031600 [Panicum hallii]|uniref:Uncharacterized protein n=1 Tax=Panicum hallii TaxID=206008 RepID=A0A2T8KMQ7_9POAL|nr:hypothetical protein PAHAL_2G031600 [Panicum hallii]